jgi:hypothetical protein
VDVALLPKEGSFATDRPSKVIGAKLSQNNTILVNMDW